MVLDYSKWDALELSDDSDIEVHPNVDKRSFIRAKQNQIHMEREQRRHEIKTLKYERIINDGLMKRIDALLAALKEHEAEHETKNPDEVVFKVILSAAADSEDTPPSPPEGVHANIKDQQKFSQMLSSLADQVKKELEEKKTAHESVYKGYIAGVQSHKEKVADLQSQLLKRLEELEKIEGSKITSDSIHTGFDHSYIAKAKAEEEEKKKKKAAAEKKESVELLNPGATAAQSSSAAEEADDEDDDEDEGEEQDKDDIKVSPLAKRFAQVRAGDYRASMEFIQKHKNILKERKTDELLMEAFDAVLENKEDYGRQCVHQGLLLQYCRSLGPDGISLFFKRITTPGHRAGTLFRDDVNDTFAKIRTRAGEIAAASANANSSGEVEQIQLHAVDPTKQLNILIPPENSTEPEHQKQLEALRSFSPDMQRALESRSLDEVNLVLGRMKIEEAEKVVEVLGDSGILQLEEGIVDATTEEGKRRLKELEEGEEVEELVEEKGAAQTQAQPQAKEDVGEPGNSVDEID